MITERIVVLVVEDDILVRSYEVAALELEGFTALEASDAYEAVRLLEIRPDIRLVLTDLQMPGDIDGLGLAWVINQRWSDLPVLAVSGRPRPDDLPETSEFMGKPFAVDELVSAVRGLAIR